MLFFLKKIIGVLFAIFGSSALLIIYFFPSRLILLAVVVVWWLFLFWSFYFFSFSKKNIFLHISTSVASLSLLSLIEWEPLLWFLILFNGIIFGFLWHWSLVSSSNVSRFQYKTLRRLVVVLWIFNMYAWFTVIFALHTFFQDIPLWFLTIIAGSFGGFVASIIWSLYFKSEIKKYTLWILIIGLGVIEMMWVLQLLPLGYLTLGLLLTWMWYLGQLFIRFHLSLRGIVWKRQRLFLAINAILYIFTLYIIRWI